MLTFLSNTHPNTKLIDEQATNDYLHFPDIAIKFINCVLLVYSRVYQQGVQNSLHSCFKVCDG